MLIMSFVSEKSMVKRINKTKDPVHLNWVFLNMLTTKEGGVLLNIGNLMLNLLIIRRKYGKIRQEIIF